MPTNKDVEVWVEDSQHERLNHREVPTDLVDERTTTVKIEMPRNECFTVHCLSPLSVFCDVYVVTSSCVRKRAARFHLDQTLAISENTSGSSVGHAEGRFRDHGLRTPKRAIRKGQLGSIEVEIRRIGQIVKGENQEGCETHYVDKIDFIMIDDFGQPPWLVFRFDIETKGSRAPPSSTTDHIGKRRRPNIFRNWSQAPSGSQPTSAEGSKYPKRYLRSNEFGENSMLVDSDQLQTEYEKEEAEEQRLLQKLQERLDAKKTRNIELRRMLGETP